MMMKRKDCKHYNGATMPEAGLCNATQARTFATTVCFNGLFSPVNRTEIAQRYREAAAPAAVLFNAAVGSSSFFTATFPFIFPL